MSSHTYSIHVVKKNDIASHATVSLTTTIPQLPPGHIRARSLVVGLTSNNLSYAKGGTLLKWWTGFLLPAGLPSPYSNSDKYGIVPVWGYGVVTESKVEGLQEGELIWGFWASHDMPTDLKLKKVEDGAKGHYIEASGYRTGMMNLYQRCSTSPSYPRLQELESDQDLKNKLGWASSAGTMHESGWAINRFIFNTETPIHPLGSSGGSWSQADADLSSTVVISMSASGKTARACTDCLMHERRARTGPLAFMAVTSSVDESLVDQDTAVPTKVVQYSSLTSPATTSWLNAHAPSRIIILDFTSRGNSLNELLSLLKTNLPGVKTTVLGIGGEPKAHSPSELAELAKTRAAMSERVQMNMSGIRDTALDLIGAETYFQDRYAAWDAFVGRGGLNGMRLEWLQGISGQEGLEGAWSRLSEGKMIGLVLISLGMLKIKKPMKY
ncbi:uncharacterized protein MYCFIDRAFT_215761 [Pseudocercospora fijiensis CIRAD86]|uniref:Uncharacterized protein n=1 Tax=Pseudocercospora fijiensis (strain CIRAD86) TaxID=383855 RepID=M3ATP2_PSEFD|nr:uncharacterized protein MYCFIDRAFT_215761 [Pseudocercospora fijiensis CIRAD86]EME80847.1 hypothetical protein MYCFIDRAFT_215761 [Pseudocercospora fijiensis CIRAD86]